jgi:hypothetical protein
MNGGFQQLKDVFELLSYAAVVVGVPAGLFQYYRTVKKEQQDREYGTYNALDEKYLEFEKLCLEHPYLDVFDIPDQAPIQLTEPQKKEELIAFTMLFSIFERACLMYSDESTAIKQRQWTGWEEYIRRFCKRENFRRAWATSGNTFDTTFQDYMAQCLRELRNAPASRAKSDGEAR